MIQLVNLTEAGTARDAMQRANRHVRDYLAKRLDTDATDIARAYAGSRESLLAKLRGIYDTYLADEPTYVKARQTGAWARMQKTIDFELDQLTDEIGQRAVARVAELLDAQPAQLERRLGKKLLGRFIRTPKSTIQILGELTSSMIGGGTFEDRITHMSDDLKAKLTSQVRSGLINGDDFATLRGKLAKSFGVDKLQKPQYSAYGSVKIYKNEARRQWNLLMKDQAKTADGVMVWYAEMDENTTPGCAARHGRLIDEDLDGEMPPRHYNCRCTVAVFDEGDREELQDMRDESRALLASLGYSRAEAELEEAGNPYHDDRGRFTSGGASAGKGDDVPVGSGSGGDSKGWEPSPEVTQRGYGRTDDWEDHFANEVHQIDTGSNTIKLGNTVYDARVDHYVKLLQENPANVPPVMLFKQKDGSYVVTEGNHRYAAAMKLGITRIPAVVFDSETIENIPKPRQKEANPYHDERGRFGSAGSTGGVAIDHELSDVINTWADANGGQFDGVQERPRGQEPLVLISVMSGGKKGSTGGIPLSQVSKRSIQAKLDALRQRGPTQEAGWGWGHHRILPMVRIQEVWHDAGAVYRSLPWRRLPRLAAGRLVNVAWGSLDQALAPDDVDLALTRHFRGSTDVFTSEGWRPLRPSVYLIETLTGFVDDSAMIQPPWDLREDAKPALTLRVAAVVMSGEKIWAVRPPDYPHWVLPGGHIEEGESNEQAVVREMYEETGQRVRVIRPLGFYDSDTTRTICYLCEHFMRDPRWTPDAEETAATMPVLLEELDTLERRFLTSALSEAGNPYHDAKGMFTHGGGGGSGEKEPPAKRRMGIGVASTYTDVAKGDWEGGKGRALLGKAEFSVDKKYQGQQLMSKAISALDQLPAHHIDLVMSTGALRGLHILPGVPAGGGHGGYGLSSQSIKLYPDVMKSQKADFSTTLTHEVGHAVDAAMGHQSQTADIEHISSYGKLSPTENWAEAYALFSSKSGREQMAAYTPKAYQHMSQIFGTQK